MDENIDAQALFFQLVENLCSTLSLPKHHQDAFSLFLWHAVVLPKFSYKLELKSGRISLKMIQEILRYPAPYVGHSTDSARVVVVDHAPPRGGQQPAEALLADQDDELAESYDDLDSSHSYSNDQSSGDMATEMFEEGLVNIDEMPPFELNPSDLLTQADNTQVHLLASGHIRESLNNYHHEHCKTYVRQRLRYRSAYVPTNANMKTLSKLFRCFPQNLAGLVDIYKRVEPVESAVGGRLVGDTTYDFTRNKVLGFEHAYQFVKDAKPTILIMLGPYCKTWFTERFGNIRHGAVTQVPSCPYPTEVFFLDHLSDMQLRSTKNQLEVTKNKLAAMSDVLKVNLNYVNELISDVALFDYGAYDPIFRGVVENASHHTDHAHQNIRDESEETTDLDKLASKIATGVCQRGFFVDVKRTNASTGAGQSYKAIKVFFNIEGQIEQVMAYMQPPDTNKPLTFNKRGPMLPESSRHQLALVARMIEEEKQKMKKHEQKDGGNEDEAQDDGGGKETQQSKRRVIRAGVSVRRGLQEVLRANRSFD